MKIWSSEDLDDLSDNYQYYLEHKTEAEGIFSTTWRVIRLKATRIGCTTERFKRCDLSSMDELINGLLLSDGGVYTQSNLTGYFTQDSINCDWLDYIKLRFECSGVMCLVSNRFNHGFSNNIIYNLHTKHYIEFKELRNKWYKKWYDNSEIEEFRCIKTVPRDIKFDSECVLNWYLGDGSFTSNCGVSPQVTFSTQGFNYDDVCFLSDGINNSIDVHSIVRKNNTIGMYRKSEIKSFFNYVGKCNISSFGYKFPKEFTS